MPDIDPLMKGNAQRVIRIDVLRQPVHNFFTFGLKAAEEVIPYDENAGVVAIEIALV